VLAAHLDVRPGRAYLRLRKQEEHIGCSRSARERAQLELVRRMVASGAQGCERRPLGLARVRRFFYRACRPVLHFAALVK